MQLKNVFATVSAILMLVACGGNNPDKANSDVKSTGIPVLASKPVEIDITTPDRALKSYWKVQDQFRSEYHAHYKAQLPVLERFQAPVENVMTGTASSAAKEKLGALETFIRDIVDVKIESESRAVIIASIKNSTPIPAGAELSKLAEQMRSEGDKYKYVLEKSQPGWRIAEIWDYDKYITTPDWRKTVPGDGKPPVSLSTYGGR